MLSDESDAQIALEQILIKLAVEQKELWVRFHDVIEELARYYQLLGWEFTCLRTYLGAP